MHYIALPLACLLLLPACQREASPNAEPSEPATATTAPAQATIAASAAAIQPFDVAPFGIESCDAFVAAINHCFATAKVHPSAVKVLRPPYEQELQRWRRMKDEPNLASGLDRVCQTQLDGMATTREGFKCE